MIDLTQHLEKLFLDDLLDSASYVYIKLRSLSPIEPIKDVYYALDYAMDVMDAFFAACKLAQKGFIKIDPFPTLGLRLASYGNLTEQEVKASADTIGENTYLYNVMQVEARLARGTMFYINQDFQKKWNITTDQLIINLPKILKLYDRFARNDIMNDIPARWLSKASINPFNSSIDELNALDQTLGVSSDALVFWTLQNESAQSKAIDLSVVSQRLGISLSTSISALNNLVKSRILSYTLDGVKITWKQNITGLSTAELNLISPLLKAEGKIMYKLKALNSESINVQTFCAANELTKDDFYNYLRNLKSKDFLDYIASGFNFSWGYGYAPKPQPTPTPTPAPTPTPTPTPAPTVTPFLDKYPDARVALSTRKLSSTNRTLYDLVNGEVTNWYDQSAYALTASKSPSVAGPTFDASTNSLVTNKGYVTLFDLNTSHIVGSQGEISIFAVFRSNPGDHSLIENYPDYPRSRLISINAPWGDGYTYFYSGDYPASEVKERLAFPQFSIGSFLRSADQVLIRKNGVEVVNTQNPSPSFETQNATNLVIGGGNANRLVQAMDGAIQELIIFKGFVSNYEAIEREINSYYKYY